ncbi:MAG: hypothetical protein Q8L26_08030 [Candidatus Omnitrophota bacterium]|nr:hypothetical protein [Candidatus Omnitrophota bacterium]
MSEQFKHNDSLPHVSAEQDVMALVKKMQQQLISLEKKIDILINQSQDRPFRQKPFSKPFRSFGHHRRPEREHGDASEGKSFDRARHFEKRPYGEKRGFGYKKESYGNYRESNFTPERPFKKRYDPEKRGFGRKRESYGNPQESTFTKEHHFEKRSGPEKRGFDQKKKPFHHK